MGKDIQGRVGVDPVYNVVSNISHTHTRRAGRFAGSDIQWGILSMIDHEGK